jgi:hypothetical protein
MQIFEKQIDPNEFYSGVKKYNIQYGSNENYESPFSPSFVVLSQSDQREFELDLEVLALLYSTATSLYLDSITNSQHQLIKGCVESSLSDQQILATQITASGKLEPAMTRVDYISFDNGFHKIAEVQWKSGGPGFLIGHDLIFREIYDLETSTHPFGNLVEQYLFLLRNLILSTNSKAGCVINELRNEWLQSEQFLINKASDLGFDYIPVSRKSIAESLLVNENNKFTYKDNGKSIAVLRGRGFSDIISGSNVICLAKKSVQGEIWTEIPLNYILRQKWPMALPFIPQYKHLFSDRLRNILAPTIIIRNQSIDFSPIIDFFAKEYRERLISINNISQLVNLPESLRRMLIIKNGSGIGDMQNRGKGVFRLTGSRAYVKKNLDPIIHSMLFNNETWIIQPFISKKYSVPHIQNHILHRDDCHARFMLFGERKNHFWSTQGALVNFSNKWKVTGSNEASLVSVRTII